MTASDPTASGPVRRFGLRAAVVVAVLAGLFGMHGLSADHAAMAMDVPVAAARDTPVTAEHPTAGQMTAPVPPGPGGSARTVGVVAVPVLSGQPGTGGAGHTGMTSMSCVAVLAVAIVLALSVFRRVRTRRRGGPSWPASSQLVSRRVTPRVVVVPRALSLVDLCLLRV